MEKTSTQKVAKLKEILVQQIVGIPDEQSNGPHMPSSYVQRISTS